jgi:preprotein translocase subunit SecF
VTATRPPELGPVRRSIFSRLYNGETDIEFVGHFGRWLLISGVVIVAGLVSLFTRGLNLGIDFEGGSVWEVDANEASIEDARDAVADAGLDSAVVQTLESDGEVRLRVEAEEADNETRTAVTDALVALTEVENADAVSFTSVGPSWGEEISRKALRALIFFLIAITIYITLRFEWKMALPTLAALAHDILVTVGVYSLFGFEVTPATVIAILTILGYSIYDGIVVFDKVDENTKMVSSAGGTTYSAMVNTSLNQVLMRSLNTSITALLPVASLLLIGSAVLGAVTLQEFALALLIGLFASAYSSVFIASPLLAHLKERERRYRDIRARVEARGGVQARAAAAGTATASASRRQAEGDAEVDDAATVETAAAPTVERVIPPRPRKKTRRRR